MIFRYGLLHGIWLKSVLCHSREGLPRAESIPTDSRGRAFSRESMIAIVPTPEKCSTSALKKDRIVNNRPQMFPVPSKDEGSRLAFQNTIRHDRGRLSWRIAPGQYPEFNFDAPLRSCCPLWSRFQAVLLTSPDPRCPDAATSFADDAPGGRSHRCFGHTLPG